MPTIESAGVPIYYELIGEGTPIVLVHGFLSSFEANWVQTGWVDYLVGLGRQVVGVDCRGHGRSGKPHYSSAYDGYQIADDLIAVLDAIDLERTDLMGYSMGGRIAIKLMARAPARLKSVVAGGAGIRRVRPETRAATAAALETDDVSTITDPAALFMRQMAESRKTDPTSLAGLDNDLRALAALVRSDDKVVYDPAEIVEALHRVQVPVLAAVGEKDNILPEAQELVATVPVGELVVLPGEDHLTAVRSEKYKDAVALFLGMHAASTA